MYIAAFMKNLTIIHFHFIINNTFFSFQQHFNFYTVKENSFYSKRSVALNISQSEALFNSCPRKLLICITTVETSEVLFHTRAKLLPFQKYLYSRNRLLFWRLLISIEKVVYEKTRDFSDNSIGNFRLSKTLL